MSVNSAPNRKSVREFFDFTLEKGKLEKRDINPFIIVIAGLIGGALAWIALGFAGSLVGLLIGGAAGIAVDQALIKADLRNRSDSRQKNLDEFHRLARETRAVQASDLIKAFLRIFERTQIDRADLRVLDQIYSLQEEKTLFDYETLENRLGDLINKSIRLISAGDFSNKRIRKVRWPRTGHSELIFNPMRLDALFLTSTQLTICGVQIDSIDGDLREEIQRISLPKIVNIHFTAERVRTNLKADEMLQKARQLDYEEDEIESFREKIAAPKASSVNWVYEEMTSQLKITRTDGGLLAVPIRSEFYLGEHVSALDQETALTQDEVTVDRMINELNRLVETAK